jgi:hypothetical protein
VLPSAMQREPPISLASSRRSSTERRIAGSRAVTVGDGPMAGRPVLHAFGIVRLSAVGHWLTLGWRPDSCCRVPCSVSRPSRWRAVAVARSSVELQVRVVCACNSSGRRVTRSAKRMAARAAWTGGCKTAQGMASSARGCEQRSSVGHSRARSSERGLAVGDHRAVSVGAAVS